VYLSPLFEGLKPQRAPFSTPKELANGALWGSRRELFEGELIRDTTFGVDKMFKA